MQCYQVQISDITKIFTYPVNFPKLLFHTNLVLTIMNRTKVELFKSVESFFNFN